MTSVLETGDRTLSVLLGDLLPPDVGIAAMNTDQVVAFAAQHARTSQLETLQKIITRECTDASFAALDAPAREAVLARIRRKHLKAFADFFLLALQCYCLDPGVRQAFGDIPGAPFPAGRDVPDGNLELLEAVYERGPIFRVLPPYPASEPRLTFEDSPPCS